MYNAFYRRRAKGRERISLNNQQSRDVLNSPNSHLSQSIFLSHRELLPYGKRLSEGPQPQQERHLPLIITNTVNLNLHCTLQWTYSSPPRWTAFRKFHLKTPASGRVCETQFWVIFIPKRFFSEHLLNHAVFWDMLNNILSADWLVLHWKSILFTTAANFILWKIFN